MRGWCRYLSGARCRLFAYGPADATAIPKPHHLLPHSNPDWFLPFWYQLTQAVVEKRLLNECSSSTSSSTRSKTELVRRECWSCWEKNRQPPEAASVFTAVGFLAAARDVSSTSGVRSTAQAVEWLSCILRSPGGLSCYVRMVESGRIYCAKNDWNFYWYGTTYHILDWYDGRHICHTLPDH